MGAQYHALFPCLSSSNKQEFAGAVDKYLKNTECEYSMENHTNPEFYSLD